MNIVSAFLELDKLYESTNLAEAQPPYKVLCQDYNDNGDECNSWHVFHDIKDAKQFISENKDFIVQVVGFDLDEDLISCKESTELSTEHAINSVVDQVKAVYEAGLFSKLPIGRDNAYTLEISGPDKERLAGYFAKQPEFNQEVNDDSGIVSYEFISNDYDIELFDSFISMYRIPQNESVNRVANTQNINENINKENYEMNFQTVLEELDRLYETPEVDEAEALTEADEDVLIDDEPIIEDEAVEAEEEPIEEDPKQLILECSKCGGIVIKDEADVTVDEETDLANADEACQYCEEAEGYKIIGVVAPYEAGEKLDEGIFDRFKTIPYGKIKNTYNRTAVKAKDLKKGDLAAEASPTSRFDDDYPLYYITKIKQNKDGTLDIHYWSTTHVAVDPEDDYALFTPKQDINEGIFDRFKTIPYGKIKDTHNKVAVKAKDLKKGDLAYGSPINAKFPDDFPLYYITKVKQNKDGTLDIHYHSSADISVDPDKEYCLFTPKQGINEGIFDRFKEIPYGKIKDTHNRTAVKAKDLKKGDLAEQSSPNSKFPDDYPLRYITKVKQTKDGTLDIHYWSTTHVDVDPEEDYALFTPKQNVNEGIFDKFKKKKDIEDEEPVETSEYSDDDYIVVTQHPKTGTYHYVQGTPPRKNKKSAEDDMKYIDRPTNNIDGAKHQVVAYKDAKKMVGRPFR